MARQGPKEVEVLIEGLTTEGLGTTSYNERPVHVRNALPGETVRARILKRRKGIRYADGIETIADGHSSRAQPECEYFPRCGGCSLQHMAYGEQLKHKEGLVRAALEQWHIVPGSWCSPRSCGTGGYRRKARLGVRVVGDQVLVGFRESFSNRVSRMDTCATLTPQLSALIAPLKQTIARCSEPDRIPQIELAQGDDGVVVIVRHLSLFTDSDLDLWKSFETETTALVLLQPQGYDSVRSLSGANPSELRYALDGLEMRFDPRQFTQVNAAMNEVLVAQAMGYLRPGRGRRIIDLFCGIGNFSLPLARAGAEVLGVEFAEESVAQAALNADYNDIESARFQCMNLYEDSTFVAQCRDADSLLLDPPRSGAGPLLGQWLRELAGLEQLVYVSCQPRSFAEDVHTMQQHGFELVEVGAYDMFPQTAHVETIGYLRKR